MIRRYLIEPNDTTSPTVFTVYCIWDDEEDEWLGDFDTREAAQEFISKILGD